MVNKTCISTSKKGVPLNVDEWWMERTKFGLSDLVINKLIYIVLIKLFNSDC